MNSRKANQPAAIGALLVAVLCWGTGPVATRYLVGYLSPAQLVLVRFFLSSLIFLPTLRQVKARHWEYRDIIRTIVCGLTSVIGYNLCVAYGIGLLPASIASILIATEPIWIALLSLAVLHERIHWTVLLGLGLAALGVCVLLGWGTPNIGLSRTTLIGAGLTLLAAMMWGIYTLAARPLSDKYGALTSTGITTIVGTIPLLAWYDPQLFSKVAHLNGPDWYALLLLVVGGTVLATILWNYGAAHLSGTQAGLFLYLNPCVGVVGSSLLLHEPVTGGTLASGLLIITGVVVAQSAHIQIKGKFNRIRTT